MTSDSVKQQLMGFVEQSTKLINANENLFRFHWQYGEYKFFNIYLVYWFEQEFNCWVDFIDRKVDLVKQEISKISSIDANTDYDLIHLQRLRDRHDQDNKKLALCFSGGYDSTYVFKKAVDNNIWFDQVVSSTGLSIDLPHSEEMKHNVIPWTKDYPDAFGKFRLNIIPEEDFEEQYKDKNYIFNDPCYAMPRHLHYQWVAFKGEQDYTYIRVETNATLIYKNKKWYAAVLNKNFSGSQFLNLSQFWVDPENIISFLNNAIKTKNYIIENYTLSDSETQFFRPSNEELFDVLGFTKLYNPHMQGPKNRMANNNKLGYARGLKDTQYMEWLVNNREDTLMDIFRGIDYFYTTCGVTIENHLEILRSTGKFAWLIDLDTLEIYSQGDIL